MRTMHLTLIIWILLTSCAAQTESPVLLLPQEADDYDSLMRVGTRQYYGSAGLSLVKPPSSSKAYYVIDRRAVARRLAMETLGAMSSRGIISITQDQGLSSRIVHLELNDSNLIVVRSLVFDVPLLSQLYEKMSITPLNLGSASSFEYVEYSFPGSECENLSSSISRIDSSLRDAAANIGVNPPLMPGEIEEVIIDGTSYSVKIRLEELLGTFNVGQNSCSLFEAVQTTMITVQECSSDQQGGWLKNDTRRTLRR